jgi:hypothetical protein
MSLLTKQTITHLDDIPSELWLGLSAKSSEDARHSKALQDQGLA